MPYAMNFYRDQINFEGVTASPLAAASRFVYIRDGSVNVNGRRMNQGEAAYLDVPVELASTGEWGEMWRWDLVAPNRASMLHQGAGVLSNLRMSRVIASLALAEGTQWLFRLDQIISAAGRVSNPHKPNPGIRCLLEGTFNINQQSESMRDILPGDPWWENGFDSVIAWGAQQMPTVAIRCMICPPSLEGKPTGSWLSSNASTNARSNWNLFEDRIITV